VGRQESAPQACISGGGGAGSGFKPVERGGTSQAHHPFYKPPTKPPVNACACTLIQAQDRRALTLERALIRLIWQFSSVRAKVVWWESSLVVANSGVASGWEFQSERGSQYACGCADACECIMCIWVQYIQVQGRDGDRCEVAQITTSPRGANKAPSRPRIRKRRALAQRAHRSEALAHPHQYRSLPHTQPVLPVVVIVPVHVGVPLLKLPLLPAAVALLAALRCCGGALLGGAAGGGVPLVGAVGGPKHLRGFSGGGVVLVLVLVLVLVGGFRRRGGGFKTGGWGGRLGCSPPSCYINRRRRQWGAAKHSPRSTIASRAHWRAAAAQTCRPPTRRGRRRAAPKPGAAAACRRCCALRWRRLGTAASTARSLGW